MNEKIDSLIIVAMKEEVAALEKSGFFALYDEDKSLENFPYRTFSYEDKDGEQRKGFLVSPGEIGDKSREAAVLFSKEYRPAIVLNVGISGRVKDSRVGDVVVPSQLNLTDHRSDLQDDGNGGYTIRPGGRYSEASENASFVLNRPSFEEDNKLQSLSDYMHKVGYAPNTQQANRIDEWKQEGSLANHPSVIIGSFAAGRPVLKSPTYKSNVLQAIDRNIIAFDNESASIADSLKALVNRPQFFAVRAISDPADDRKREFDAIGDGLFRRWAMQNATTTLKTLLQYPALYGRRALFGEDIKQEYLENYPGQKLLVGSVADFDARFANLFVLDDKLAVKRETFSAFIAKLVQGGPGDRILIQGHGGAGKSALLRKTWASLREQYECAAVFLNARTALADAQKVGNKAAVLRRLKRDAPHFETGEQHIFVFVDELYGRSEEQALLDELEKLLTRKRSTYVFGFGVDHYNRVRSDGDDPHDTYIYNMVFERTYALKIIGIDEDEIALSIIEGILKTGHTVSTKTAVGVLEDLKSLGFLYINHFVISLYLDNSDKLSFNKTSNNSTRYVIRAMTLLYGDVYGRDQQTADFRNICVEALRSHCPELTSASPSQARAVFAQKYESTFALFPKVVQTALIAQAVVHILIQASTDDQVFTKLEISRERFISLVFANDVNSSIKDLMSEPSVEQKVLMYADSIFNELDPRGLSYALYLFGRAKTNGGKRQAKKMFDQARSVLLSTGDNVKYENDDKHIRLACRSLFISAALAGDDAATSEYIRRVLSDPTEDSLNRSFHLEYYGDDRGTGITVKLDLDDTGGNWRHTRRTLRRRIDKAIRARMANEYDRICILTYFTLVRYRLEKGTLEGRASEVDFLDELLAANFQLGTELLSFLVGLRSQLEFDTFTHIDAIVELLKLKSITRAGWSKRQMGTASVEGVGAHVFGAMLLAELLLDHAIPNISSEHRAKVIRLLLIHDLGEAYIGDYDPTDGATKSKEVAAVKRLGSLALFRTLQTTAEIPLLFEIFETGADPLARVAKDFDKLDAVFQAYIYASQFPNIEDRTKFFNYHIDIIQSVKLKAIALELARRAQTVDIVRT